MIMNTKKCNNLNSYCLVLHLLHLIFLQSSLPCSGFQAGLGLGLGLGLGREGGKIRARLRSDSKNSENILVGIHVVPAAAQVVPLARHLRTSIDSINVNASTEVTTVSSSSSSSSPSSSSLPTSRCECSTLGGSVYPIKLNNEDDGFLTAMSVPTFAVQSSNVNTSTNNSDSTIKNIQRLGLEGIIPGAFTLQNVLTKHQCEDIIQFCENDLKFKQFTAGKNNHGAMQIVVPQDTIIQQLNSFILPFIDLNSINQLAKEMKEATATATATAIGENSNDYEFDEYAPIGLNRRWRIYKYQPGGEETFAPHIDAGFPPSTVSHDGSTLIWDATESESFTTTTTTTSSSSGSSTTTTDQNNQEMKDEEQQPSTNLYPKDTVSRLTVLMYLNDDFNGGQTKFYSPIMKNNNNDDDDDDNHQNQQQQEIIASIQPKTGSILLFPQAVGEDAVEYARKNWPVHEGSPVNSGSSRPKYVIRSDVLFTKVRKGITEEERNDPLWKNDDFVRQTFMPSNVSSLSTAKVYDTMFLNHCQELYNPHMGVENVGPLLYSLVRFTKLRKVVEIGAGYTTLWILQALKDNENEMNNVKALQDEGKCRLLDIPWSIPDIVDEYTNKNDDASSLLCIDNCLHQRETATGAGAVAQALGLEKYLNFVKGDAFDMQFEEESIDLLWCDFGVGSKMKDFATNAWKSIKPGGFLVCHSTLTNSRTRSWLEMVRSGQYSEEETGIPSDEVVELSLLEPHKRYQNSISILQRRKGSKGQQDFEEPIYSEYA